MKVLSMLVPALNVDFLIEWNKCIGGLWWLNFGMKIIIMGLGFELVDYALHHLNTDLSLRLFLDFHPY